MNLNEGPHSSFTKLSWDCSSISRLCSRERSVVISDLDVWRVSVLTTTSLLSSIVCILKKKGIQKICRV